MLPQLPQLFNHTPSCQTEQTSVVDRINILPNKSSMLNVLFTVTFANHAKLLCHRLLSRCDQKHHRSASMVTVDFMELITKLDSW